LLSGRVLPLSAYAADVGRSWGPANGETRHQPQTGQRPNHGKSSACLNGFLDRRTIHADRLRSPIDRYSNGAAQSVPSTSN